MRKALLVAIVLLLLSCADVGDTCSDACWNLAQLDCLEGATTAACERDCAAEAWDTACIYDADTCAAANVCE